ncbi:MAG: NAD(P)-dependent oxidoreductase [Actinomycetota bacterium]|nr:NAD(P)-dependent oxidoreductase [Actinomycetota bacterium]
MIGFVGLGHMGEPMALNLLKAGTPLVAWNRSDTKYPLIAEAGGKVVSTVEEVFDKAWVVILMLSNGPAIDEVLGRGADRFTRNVESHVVVHMGTTAASYSKELAADIRDAGGEYVEAPVSGSRKPAEAGELIGMLAGTPAVLDEVRPILAPMFLKSVDCGDVPNALRMKLAVNLFLITQVVGLAESFHFAQSHGLDLQVFRDVLNSGPMASAVSKIKLAKLIEGDFAVQAALRDVHYNSRLISAAVREGGLVSPLIDASTELFLAAENMGHGGEDMAAVVKALTQ